MPVGHMTCILFLFLFFCLGCKIEWVLVFKHSYNVTLDCCLNSPQAVLHWHLLSRSHLRSWMGVSLASQLIGHPGLYISTVYRMVFV